MTTNEKQIIDDDDLYLAEDGSYEYQDRPFTGTARHRTRNGAVVSEIEYANGLQDGLARYWYPSGEPLGEEWRSACRVRLFRGSCRVAAGSDSAGSYRDRCP